MRWEIKNQWVPVDIKRSVVSTSERTQTIECEPTWKEGFKKAWAEAEALADDGWELVGVAPETCGRITIGQEQEGSGAVAAGLSYTAGYMLLFQRPKA